MENVRGTLESITYRNIVQHCMLREFGHPVAKYCVILVVAASSNLANNKQHVTTGRPNPPNMLRPPVLRYVAIVLPEPYIFSYALEIELTVL